MEDFYDIDSDEWDGEDWDDQDYGSDDESGETNGSTNDSTDDAYEDTYADDFHPGVDMDIPLKMSLVILARRIQDYKGKGDLEKTFYYWDKYLWENLEGLGFNPDKPMTADPGVLEEWIRRPALRHIYDNVYPESTQHPLKTGAELEDIINGAVAKSEETGKWVKAQCLAHKDKLRNDARHAKRAAGFGPIRDSHMPGSDEGNARNEDERQAILTPAAGIMQVARGGGNTSFLGPLKWKRRLRAGRPRQVRLGARGRLPEVPTVHAMEASRDRGRGGPRNPSKDISSLVGIKRTTRVKGRVKKVAGKLKWQPRSRTRQRRPAILWARGKLRSPPMVNLVLVSGSSGSALTNSSSNAISPAVGVKPAASGSGGGYKGGGTAEAATQDADGETRTSDTVGAGTIKGIFNTSAKINLMPAAEAVRGGSSGGSNGRSSGGSWSGSGGSALTNSSSNAISPAVGVKRAAWGRGGGYTGGGTAGVGAPHDRVAGATLLSGSKKRRERRKRQEDLLATVSCRVPPAGKATTPLTSRGGGRDGAETTGALGTTGRYNTHRMELIVPKHLLASSEGLAGLGSTDPRSPGGPTTRRGDPTPRGAVHNLVLVGEGV
jgi:hypothetical protein